MDKMYKIGIYVKGKRACHYGKMHAIKKNRNLLTTSKQNKITKLSSKNKHSHRIAIDDYMVWVSFKLNH